MKIAIADNCNLKFCGDLMQHWVDKGHEVRFERGASEHLAQWADLYYVEWWDANIHYLWRLYNGDENGNRTPDWDNNKKPKFVVRAIDWEVWVGLARDQRIIDWVDQVITIAPHIKNKLEADSNWGNKITLIRPGVNLDKFTVKKTETDGFQLGMVLGDMWWPKNHMAGLDIFTQLHSRDRRWRLHIRGQHEPGEYWPVMYEHYLDSRGIRNAVTLYPQVPDMNEWYENIDILLHPGMKETFSYAVAEAMTKGIAVVVNDFYGSKDIYPNKILYQTHDEAVNMIRQLHHNSDVEVLNNRNFIKEKYSNERMFKEIDELLGA